MTKRTVSLIVIAAMALPTRAADVYTISYRATASTDQPITSAGTPSVQTQRPTFPLRQPIKAFEDVNRNPENVFRQKAALPYLAVGIAALASDKQTEKWFNVPGQDERTPWFGRTFNNFGDGKVLFPAMGALYLAGRSNERDTAKLWAVSVINATIFSQSLKALAGKERPYQSPDAIRYHGPGTGYESWPSGHTTAATASAVVLGHQYPKSKYLFYTLAACVGYARIQSRAHWPSDVYWGAGVGYYSAWQTLHHKDDILTWRF